MNEKVLFFRLLKDLKEEKLKALFATFLYIPITTLNVLQPVIIGYAINHIIVLKNYSEIYFWPLAFMALVIFLSFIEYCQGLILQTVGQNLVKNLRKKAFAKAQSMPISVIEKTAIGKFLTLIVNDCESVLEMFSLGAIQIIGDLLFLLGTMIMLFIVSPKLTFYTFLMLPFLSIGLLIFRHLTQSTFYKVRNILSALNIIMQEYLSGMSTIQSLNFIKTVRDFFNKKNHEYMLANRRAVLLDASIYSFVDLMSFLAVALVILGAFFLKNTNALELGILVAFIEALNRFFNPLREISGRFLVFQSSLVSLSRIYDFLTQEEEDLYAGRKIQDFRHNIIFKQVSFSYREGEKVLSNISFVINKGEKVALVGATGSGKSTVIKLINRFYDIKEGQILLDGMDIKNISLESLRSLITIVPQEVFLFRGTLRENLCYGILVSDDEIWHALEVVQLDTMVKNSGGLNTELLSRGSNFSVGERQLLAFARALLVKKPILILDEATANIDKRTILALQKATIELIKDKTAIIIAHRLNTIRHCDRILMFKDGYVVEEGSHEALMAKKGYYESFVSMEEMSLKNK